VRAGVGEREHDVVDRSNESELVAGDPGVVPQDRRDRPACGIVCDSKLFLVPFHPSRLAQSFPMQALLT